MQKNKINKNNNFLIYIFLFIIVFVFTLFFSFVSAVSVLRPSGTSQDTITVTDITDLSSSGYNRTSYGGNISVQSLAGVIQTDHWSAYIGNVTADVLVGSTTGVGSGTLKRVFNRTLTASNIDSIAMTTTKNPNWANFKAINKEVIDRAINVTTTAADAAFNLYNNTAFTFGGVSLNTTYLNANNSQKNSNWANGIATTASSGTSYTVNTGVEDMIFIAKFNGTRNNGTFIGGTGVPGTATVSANYQLLIGVNETDATSNTEAGNRYYFWVIMK